MEDWGVHGGPDVGDFISYEEAVKEGERRILFTGPRRYGLINFFDISLFVPSGRANLVSSV